MAITPNKEDIPFNFSTGTSHPVSKFESPAPHIVSHIRPIEILDFTFKHYRSDNDQSIPFAAKEEEAEKSNQKKIQTEITISSLLVRGVWWGDFRMNESN